jgi:hypothetical protein
MNVCATKPRAWDVWTFAILLLCLIAGIAGCSKQQPAAAPEVPTAATFTSPDKAGQALEEASRIDDEAALAHYLGPQSQKLLSSGDPAEDQAARRSFVKKYERMHRWVTMSDGSNVLYIGSDNYPFPIPLMPNASSSWYFDTAAGSEEILSRRIGRNELLAIDACRAIANAEDLYFLSPHDANGAQQYTQNILSSPGTQDGLYWEVGKEEPASPLGRVREFIKEPLTLSSAAASPVFDGYTFRILTAQGQDAKGGSRNYMADGRLKNGFAIIASPVRYQDSGIMTFMLNRDGVVYQKDLGSKTAEAVASIKNYNPAHGWEPAE